jgi:hypothetical protein
MKYMILIYATPPEKPPTPEEWAAYMPAWEAYGAEIRKRGEYVDGAPLAPVDSATTVRVRDGKRAVTDGPFAETKEVLGGYYLVDCPTLDEAIELAALCPGAQYGSIEVRPLVDM